MNPWRGLKNLKKELWLLSAATLINRSGTMALPFLAIYINKHLHFSIAESGLIITVYGIAALITAPLIGRMCDSVNPFKIMKYSLLFSGLLLFLFPLAQKYYQIIILTFIWSSLNESFRPANLVLISYFSSVETRRIAFALNRLAVNLGMSIGPAIGGILVLYDYSLLFYVDGAAHIISWCFLYFTTKKMDIHKTRENEIKKVENENNQTEIKKHIFKFVLVFIPVLIVFFQIFTTFPIYITQELQYKESVYGFLFALNTVMIILLEVPLLNYLVKIKNTSLITAGSLLVGIGFMLMIFGGNIAALIISVIFWTFGEMIIFPTSAAYISEIAPEGKRGEYMGYYQTGNNTAFSLGPVLGSFIYQTYGSHILWSAAFVMAAISSAGIFIIVKKQKI